MSSQRLSKILISLPGAAFWLHLLLWFCMGTNLYGGSGENWWPVLIQLCFFVLSVAFFIVAVAIAVITRRRNGDSLHWWLAALINGSPMLLTTFIRLGAIIFQKV